jgi:hypothetical protein
MVDLTHARFALGIDRQQLLFVQFRFGRVFLRT